jgi:MYXO-CTERM domain-containing protein
MKNMRALGLLAALGAAASAFGQTYNEASDAGDMPGTAQGAVGLGALTDIFGACATRLDADMYVINISNPAAFSATTNVAPGTMTDTTLYLFNLDGTGIAKNDDVDSTNFLSIMPVGAAQYASLTPGDYLLAVGPFAFAPFWNPVPATLADLVFNINTFTGVIGPQNPGPMLGWADAGSTDAGTYHITLTGASMVPAPGAMALLGLAGLAAARRRRA